MSFTLAHLSDLHITPVRSQHLPWRLNKQTLGWIKWSLRRSKEHLPEVLEALIRDLHTQHPDHITVTGDLTNAGLADEIQSALPWLQQLGGQQHVSLIPGNHDTYADASPHDVWQYWENYLRSDCDDWPRLKALTQTASPDINKETDALAAVFPSLRIRGPVALIGLCSARPTNLFHATGYVEAAQRTRLAHMLWALADTSLCRIVVIHHPPTHVGLNRRRHLHDANALQHVLATGGVDLILHGHTHETILSHIHPSGQSELDTAIPVVGVRSASALNHNPQRMAQYHLYQIESVPCAGHRTSFRISLLVRGYDRDSGRFQPVGRYNLSPEDSPMNSPANGLMDGPIDHSAEKNTFSEAVFSFISA
jgi:3',5'-cyclic AMP phosphodiesterase CpdA